MSLRPLTDGEKGCYGRIIALTEELQKVRADVDAPITDTDKTGYGMIHKLRQRLFSKENSA